MADSGGDGMLVFCFELRITMVVRARMGSHPPAGPELVCGGSIQTTISTLEGATPMAETKDGKKFVRVKSYTRPDGVKVPAYVRSTPDTSTGPAKRPTPGRKSSKSSK